MSLTLPALSLKSARPPMNAGTCGQRIVAALPLLWAKWVSLHDAAGEIYWHHGEVLGPAEREAIRVALESFAGGGAPARVNHPLQRDRTAVLLRAEDDSNTFLGFVMLVVDDRWLRGKGTAAPDLPIPVVRAVREWGHTLAMGAQGPAEGPPASATDAHQLPALAPLEANPRVDDAEADRYLERLRQFPMELHAQHLTPIQAGTRIRRYEILMRAAGFPESSSAPSELIAGAEALGLGAVLDRRVVGELLVWLAQRSDVWANEPAQFSINLTAGALSDSNFLQFVRLCLEKAQLPRGLVAFEARHEFCARTPVYFTQLAAQLEQAGAGVVIDDFVLSETGIDLLLQPGVRLVKLDAALTRDLVNDRGRQARVAAIAQAARVAGVHVVAKNVECPEAQALLQALGVDFMQGYAAGAPAPLDTVEARMAELRIIDPQFGEEQEEVVDAEPRFAATG
jgi:EAL domain-containing protein (putative c-di-GMP-specific phosphodiesterase class I)